MRIKLRCPHCGDWFTLTLAIEDGEPETRAADVDDSEKPELPRKPAQAPIRRSRARLIGAVCTVAAVVIIVWAVVATLSDRGAESSAPEAVSALPMDASAEDDRTQGDPAERDRTQGDPAERDRTQEGPVERDPTQADPAVQAAADADASDTSAAQADVTEDGARDPEPAAALERGLLQLVLVASERCWIRVRADGVVVADTTLNAGERREWRADGFFELDVGAGDAVQLYLNDEDLGTAGASPRVVEGLRLTKDGIRRP